MTPEPEDPAPDLTNEEILSRLDEVLEGADDDDLEELDEIVPVDTAPPDIDIPEEAEEPPEATWAPVEDGTGDDLPLPDDDAPEAPEEIWAPTQDDGAPDLEVEALVEEAVDDAWAPVGYGAIPESERAGRVLSDPGFRVPRTAQPPALLPSPRTLPWRSTGDLLAPDLPKLLCLADPTSTGSRLLVAAWGWADETSGNLLRFRLSDDGPEIEAAPAVPHEAVLETTLKIRDQELRVRLHLDAVRDHRGVVLGRDVLAGRFVIDPALEDWSEDE